MDTTYIVQNPRGVPAGVPIISWSDGTIHTDWLEGDEFIKPTKMASASVKDFIAGALLVKKGG